MAMVYYDFLCTNMILTSCVNHHKIYMKGPLPYQCQEVKRLLGLANRLRYSSLYKIYTLITVTSSTTATSHTPILASHQGGNKCLGHIHKYRILCKHMMQYTQQFIPCVLVLHYITITTSNKRVGNIHVRKFPKLCTMNQSINERFALAR